MSKNCLFIYFYIFSILKTALPILMKPTLLTSFEDDKAIWLSLEFILIDISLIKVIIDR